MSSTEQYAAFIDGRRIAEGDREVVSLAVQGLGAATQVLVFDRESGRTVDLDPRAAEVLESKRGRPKLGVTAREVTLLPRHWEWLARQQGGASTTLRKLVEVAMKADVGATEARERVEKAYRVMSVIAGDRPGFEEASRALFAGDRPRLESLVRAWPQDIGDEIGKLLGPA